MGHTEHQLHPYSRLIRHCRARWVDGGELSVEAFELRERDMEKGDAHLSFTWLERMCEKAEIPSNISAALEEVEGCPPLNINPGDLWIVLTCDRISNAIQEAGSTEPEIAHRPTDWNHAHVGVGGYDTSLNFDIAVALVEEVRVGDTHYISVKKKRCRRP